MKKLIASLAMVGALAGTAAVAAAPAAQADPGIIHNLIVVIDPSIPCLNLFLYVHGMKVIDTRPAGVCL